MTKKNMYSVLVTFMAPSQAQTFVVADNPDQVEDIVKALLPDKTNVRIVQCVDVDEAPDSFKSMIGSEPRTVSQEDVDKLQTEMQKDKAETGKVVSISERIRNEMKKEQDTND